MRRISQLSQRIPILKLQLFTGLIFVFSAYLFHSFCEKKQISFWKTSRIYSWAIRNF